MDLFIKYLINFVCKKDLVKYTLSKPENYWTLEESKTKRNMSQKNKNKQSAVLREKVENNFLKMDVEVERKNIVRMLQTYLHKEEKKMITKKKCTNC